MIMICTWHRTSIHLFWIHFLGFYLNSYVVLSFYNQIDVIDRKSNYSYFRIYTIWVDEFRLMGGWKRFRGETPKD